MKPQNENKETYLRKPQTSPIEGHSKNTEFLLFKNVKGIKQKSELLTRLKEIRD